MLTQSLRINARILTRNAGLRAFSSSPMVKSPHRKAHLSPEEEKEQKLFDRNKAKLDKLEHNEGSSKRDSKAKLKKRGDDARIEQNRPDDGVY